MATELTFAFGTYRGEVNEAGLRHGHGELHYRNGNRVEGEWLNGALTGSGAKHFSNGDRYEGGFLNGMKHGEGVYTFRAGPTYKGQYENDKQHGMGEWSGNNEVYRGAYVHGKRCGTGMEIANRKTYEGEWQGGEKHGKGRLTFEDGAYWEGVFSQGQPTQDGKQFSADGQLMDPAAPAAAQKAVLPGAAPTARPAASTALPPAPAVDAEIFDMLGDTTGDPARADLMKAFEGMNAFGQNLSQGLERATSGLDALENQLNDLSRALGVDDAGDFGELGGIEAELAALSLGGGPLAQGTEGAAPATYEGAAVLGGAGMVQTSLIDELDSVQAELDHLQSNVATASDGGSKASR